MIFVVDGNVGSGKSSLIYNICEYLVMLVGRDNVAVVEQPDILPRCHNNTLQFHINALFAMHSSEREAVRLSESGKLVLMESVRYTLGPALAELTDITEQDKDIFKSLCERYPPLLGGDYKDYFRLFLDTPAHVCLARIRTRGRQADEHVTKKFLEALTRNLERTRGMLIEAEPLRMAIVDGSVLWEKPMSVKVRRHVDSDHCSDYDYQETFLAELFISLVPHNLRIK